jgi:methionyl aminopeptidase
MTVTSEADVIALKKIGAIVSRTLHTMLDAIEPGMTTRELDAIGAAMLKKYQANSAPFVTYNFPGATCISVNEEAAHGIPGDRVIQPGDVVNVDVSAELGGYFADTGGTRVVPPVTEVKERLCRATWAALENAMQYARAGRPINGIGRAIEQTAQNWQFRIIENLGSHGIGRSLHEAPDHIAGYYDPKDKRVLKEGMVITIEPFLSTKSHMVHEQADGWTLSGVPGNLSAQFEHTMIITKGHPIITTLH